MEPTKELIEELFWDKVQAAREQSFEDKLLAGPRLFDLCCELARTGIRMQNPDADEPAVERELDRRLAIARRLEELR